MSKIVSDIELAIRAIEGILPTIPTKELQKWKGILTTALIKINAELNSTQNHVCDICSFEEHGYRDELPISWREKDDLVICFNHEDNKIAKSKPVNTEKTLEDLMEML